MIGDRNFTCAASLLRLQLDSALRFSASFIVEDPHEFALAILDGQHVRRLIDRNGKKMTDRYLLEQLTDDYPWIESVYENTSGYIHLSSKHMQNSFTDLDEAGRSLMLSVSATDKPLPDEIYTEAIDAFHQATNILLRYVEGWAFTKDHPERVQAMKHQRSES